jgi:hypothetical protein
MPETIGTRRVERRFFVRAVMYIDHLHVFIFKSQLIMLGFNLGGVLGLTQKE